MFKNQKLLLAILLTVQSFVFGLSADTLFTYRTSGINGGPPITNLTVFDDGVVVLTVDQFDKGDTITTTISQEKLKSLIDLFEINNFSSLDSIFFSGCLSCPDFSIYFNGHKVSGNLFNRNEDLTNIKTGLDNFIEEVKHPSKISLKVKSNLFFQYENKYLSYFGNEAVLIDIFDNNGIKLISLNKKGQFQSHIPLNPGRYIFRFSSVNEDNHFNFQPFFIF